MKVKVTTESGMIVEIPLEDCILMQDGDKIKSAEVINE
jgi:hypothetical protein